jgi:hypothetical protein
MLIAALALSATHTAGGDEQFKDRFLGMCLAVHYGEGGRCLGLICLGFRGKFRQSVFNPKPRHDGRELETTSHRHVFIVM